MAVDVNKLVTLEHLGNLATRTVKAIEPTFKSAKAEGNAVYFYTSSDTTGTVAFTFDFPEELFLDQAGTTLVENFAWTAETYPNSANPNLEGKTVLVLAVKGDKETNPTTKYSFVNLETLIDTYTASDTTVTIADYKVKVNVSAEANNAIETKSDGLHVDISGKMDKVTGATAGNVAIFASDGSIADSTYGIATLSDVNSVLDEILPTTSGA